MVLFKLIWLDKYKTCENIEDWCLPFMMKSETSITFDGINLPIASTKTSLPIDTWSAYLNEFVVHTTIH